MRLTLSDSERSNCRSRNFLGLLSLKGTDSGHTLLLRTNKKSYLGSSTVYNILILSSLERSKSKSLAFYKLV